MKGYEKTGQTGFPILHRPFGVLKQLEEITRVCTGVVNEDPSAKDVRVNDQYSTTGYLELEHER